MALDLFCYCSQQPREAHVLHQAAAEVLKSRFGDGLFVYEIRDVVDDHREIAGEFGLRAASRFLISVNNKETLAAQLNEVASILVGQFGKGNIVVLLNNETPLN